MGRSVNKVILIGNLCADPELRHTGTGTAVANIRLATNDKYKNNNGEWVDTTEYHNLVAWAKLAEICDEYLRKGSQVYFEGQLQTRKWQDRDGNDRYSTEVKVSEMLMLGGKGDGSERAPAQGRRKKAAPVAESSQGEDQGDFDFDDDDSYPF